MQEKQIKRSYRVVGKQTEEEKQAIKRDIKKSCGQSYKHFTLVIYDSRVVIWGIFQSGTTLESNLRSQSRYKIGHRLEVYKLERQRIETEKKNARDRGHRTKEAIFGSATKFCYTKGFNTNKPARQK